jgi:hypothetical protein
LPQEHEYDRPGVGATTGSMPNPSPEPQVHESFTTPGAFELASRQRLANINNMVDHLKLRIDLLDEVARILLEGQDYNDGDFLRWFKSHRQELAKRYQMYTKQS